MVVVFVVVVMAMCVCVCARVKLHVNVRRGREQRYGARPEHIAVSLNPIDIKK